MILAVDQGTTGTKAAVYDEALVCTARSRRRVRLRHPRPGWVESDPEVLFESVVAAGREALRKAGAAGHKTAFFGLANQGETVVAWDRRTGRAVSPAISWQCSRGVEYCAEVARTLPPAAVHERTGLRLDPYFSAVKLRWIVENIPEARTLAAKGRLAVGTTDAWIVWRLTGGKSFVTDASTASRTLLFDIRALRWDNDLLDAFGIARAWLPAPVDTCGPALGTVRRSVWGKPLKITAMVCDQPAAAFGHLMFDPGACKCTYGTGAFVQALTGDDPRLDRSGRLLTSIAWKTGPRPVYLLYGAVFAAAAALEWLARVTRRRATMHAALNRVLRRVPAELRPLCIPAFTGLGAPHWLPEASAEFRNLTLSATADDLLRAVAQGVALCVADVVDALRDEYGVAPAGLLADGGLAGSASFLRYQANILGLPVIAARDVNVTGRGCAMLAGLGAGLWTMDDLRREKSPRRRIAPDPACPYSANHLLQWRKARADFAAREQAVASVMETDAEAARRERRRTHL